jgi:hypothetical protein
VLAAVKTALRRLRRWPPASLDRRCAQRSVVRRSGRRNGLLVELRNTSCPAGAERAALRAGSLAEVGIKHSLALQEDACHCEESICNAANSASMRVPASTQCSVASAALVIVLSSNTCPMIDGIAQSYVGRVAHHNDMRLAATFRHGRYTGQRPERLIVTAAERSRSLGK